MQSTRRQPLGYRSHLRGRQKSAEYGAENWTVSPDGRDIEKPKQECKGVAK